MERIYIESEGKLVDALEELDLAIKEQKEKNERDRSKRRKDGQDEGETGELGSTSEDV